MEKRESFRLFAIIAFVIITFIAAGGEARNVRVKRQASGERTAKKLIVDGFIVSSKKKDPYPDPESVVDEGLEAVVVEGYSKVEREGGNVVDDEDDDDAGGDVEDFGSPQPGNPSSKEEQLSPVFEEIKAQDVEGREGVLETAEGSEWENVLLTTPEDAAPAVVPPKGEETDGPKAVVFPDEKLHSQPIKTKAQGPFMDDDPELALDSLQGSSANLEQGTDDDDDAAAQTNQKLMILGGFVSVAGPMQFDRRTP